MIDKVLDKKSKLMSAIKNYNILEATILCEQGVLEIMEILDLNELLLESIPNSLYDSRYPIFLLLMCRGCF
jgi:hypothetical protein